MCKILKDKIIVLIFYLCITIPLFIIISNIIGEDTLKSFIPKNNLTSSIIRSVSDNLSKSVGIDMFFEKLNQGL